MARPDQSYPPADSFNPYALPPDDSFNPYASPQAETRLTEGGIGGGPPVQFSVGEVMSRAWAIYQSRMGFSIAVMVLGYLITVVGQFALLLGTVVLGSFFPDPTTMTIVSLPVILVYLVFASWIAMGQFVAYLKVAREQPATLGDLFAGGRYLSRIALAFLLISFAAGGLMFVVTLPGSIASVAAGPESTTTAVLLGTGLTAGLLFLTIYWVYLSQFFYIILDNRSTGALDALKQSVRITRGNWWGITALYFITFLINIAGMLALGIGLLFTIPYTLLMLAVMYTAMVPPSIATKAKPAPAYLD